MADESDTVRGPRRIVTGHAGDGRSIILSDTPAPFERTLPGARFFEIWRTTAMPVVLEPGAGPEPTDAEPVIAPPPHGTSVRLIDFPPPAAGGVASPMHRTRSIDYGIVLEGQMVLILDGGAEVPLAAGDVVVQRGTNHAWLNRGPRPARMAFVLIDAAYSPDLADLLSEASLMP